MDVLHNLALGFEVALTWQNLMYCAIGCTVGTLVGRLGQSGLNRIDVRWLDWLQIATAVVIVLVGVVMSIGAWSQFATWA